MVVYRIYSFVIAHKHHWKLRLSWGKKKIKNASFNMEIDQSQGQDLKKILKALQRPP